jgi:outer membrane lipoprotein SlyB
MLSLVAAVCCTPALAQEYRYPPAPAAQTAQVQTAPPMSQPATPAPQSAEQPAAQPQAAPQPAAQPAQPAAPLCTTCGIVDSIRVIEKAGEGSGVGMVAGGVLGGLLGNQIGQGRGNTAATILGAAGGAFAGHQVEKNVKKTAQYEVNVRMDDGARRVVTYDVEPGFRSGDKVRFQDGRLTRF